MHIVTGDTNCGNITIHEGQRTELVSKEWLWCAITRARDSTMYISLRMQKQMEMFKNLVLN